LFENVESTVASSLEDSWRGTRWALGALQGNGDREEAVLFSGLVDTLAKQGDHWEAPKRE